MNIKLITLIWGLAAARFVLAFLSGPFIASEAECRNIRGGVCYTLGALSSCDNTTSDGGCNGRACAPGPPVRCLVETATLVTVTADYRPECGNASYGSAECNVSLFTCGVKESCDPAAGACINGVATKVCDPDPAIPDTPWKVYNSSPAGNSCGYFGS